jgi:death-on-curing protein
MFIDLNGARWEQDAPNIDEAEAAMLAIAAHEVDENWVADWVRQRVLFDVAP